MENSSAWAELAVVIQWVIQRSTIGFNTAVDRVISETLLWHYYCTGFLQKSFILERRWGPGEQCVKLRSILSASEARLPADYGMLTATADAFKDGKIATQGTLKHEEREWELMKFHLIRRQTYWVEVNQSRRLTGTRHTASSNGRGDVGEN